MMPSCLSLLSCLQDGAEQRGLILLTDTIHPGRQKLSSSAFTALGQVTADSSVTLIWRHSVPPFFLYLFLCFCHISFRNLSVDT